MSILVTGGGGQLGSEFAELLSACGTPFSAPNRSQLDVTDEAALRCVLQDGPEPVRSVIHTAAYTKVDVAEVEREQAYAINAGATRVLARLCAEHHVPLVYISTDFIFSGSSTTPYEITDQPEPLNVYGASKFAGEQAIQEICDQFYIIRTSWVFGPYGHNFPRAILKAAANGGPLRVVNDQVGSPTYAHDLAEAVLRLLAIPVKEEGVTVSDADSTIHPCPTPAPYGIYHVTNSGHCSWHTFAKEILRQAGWKVDVAAVSSAELARPAPRPAYSTLSLRSIQEQGLFPRAWQQAIGPFLQRIRHFTQEEGSII